MTTAEQDRLKEARAGTPWRKWGPYLSERQWGTVREDYSEDGNAWAYFSHDQARSRAYRWGEDGLAGILRRPQPALLRAGAVERRRPDPEGAPLRAHQRRGQPRRGRQGVLLLPRRDADAFLHDAGCTSIRSARSRTPTSSTPIAPAAATSSSTSCSTPASSPRAATSTSRSSTPRRRSRTSAIRITVHNRGPESARLHLLPTLWFRNTWSHAVDAQRPLLRAAPGGIEAVHADLGTRWLLVEGAPAMLFTDNESNRERLWGEANALAVREGRVPPLRRQRRDGGGESGRRRHQGGRALRARHPGRAAAPVCACGSPMPRRGVRRRSSPPASTR